MGSDKLLRLENSERKGKRFKAVFKSGISTHFGQKNPVYGTFIDHQDEQRKKNYIARHRVNEDWDDPYRAATLSRYVLWEEPTLEAAVRAFNRRFF